ncbi:MAG: hypothetical protein WBE76_24450 [Terracidiphilus sp.]
MSFIFSFATAAVLLAEQAPQVPNRPTYDNSAAPDVALEIHIDGDCRVVPNPALPVGAGKTKPFHDNAICYLEGPHDSEHGEERIQGNQLLRSYVRVSEETFVLRNITDRHIVFIVERPVPKGWTVDSDPQPNRYLGSTAIFPVHAQPEETVRLHVGIRRTTLLKPKSL